MYVFVSPQFRLLKNQTLISGMLCVHAYKHIIHNMHSRMKSPNYWNTYKTRSGGHSASSDGLRSEAQVLCECS